MDKQSGLENGLKDQLDRAIALFNHIEAQLTFADNKAQATFAVAAIIAAALTVAEGTLIGSVTPSTATPPAWYLVSSQVIDWLLLSSIWLSIVLSLLALIPRLRVRDQSTTIWYFGHICTSPEAQFIEKFTGQHIKNCIDEVLSQAHSKAKLARTKFLLIKASVICLIAGSVLWALSQALTLYIGG